ncbi:MAG: hypothetical protein PSX37_13110, partial [bacterium]|nr:hypothetical protein [bacterium]
VGGDVFLQGARLEAFEPAVANDPADRPLSLRGRNASIAGVLRGGVGGSHARSAFRPFVCTGGVSFPNAVMDKVDLGGARIAGGKAGLDFSSTVIGGGLSMRAVEVLRPGRDPKIWVPVLVGPLKLIDAEVSGDVEVDALLSPGPHTGADDARIRLDADLTLIDPPVCEAVNSGPLLDASGLRVTGSLVVGECLSDPEGLASKLIVRSLRHAGAGEKQLSPSGNDPSTSKILLIGARIGRNLTVHLGSVRTIIRAKTLVVDGDIVLHGVASTPGVLPVVGIDLPGGRVGQSFDVRGVDVSWLDAPSFNVGRNIKMREGRLSGPIVLSGARIVASVHLKDLELRAVGEPGARGFGHDLLSFAGAVIAGQLVVRKLVSPPDTAFPGLEPTINLSFLDLGQLNDLAGTSWPARSTMNLRGLTYKSIVFNDNDPENLDAHRWVQADEALRKKYSSNSVRVLMGLIATFAVAINAPTIIHHFAIDGDFSLAALFLISPFVLYYARRYLYWINIKRVHHRLSWMDQQYTSDNKISVKLYFPQPFTQLARTYRAHGLHEFADTVLARRARFEARTKTHQLSEAAERRSSSWGMTVVRFFTISLPTWVYDVTFGFGLSAWAAIITFLCYSAAGVFLFMAEADQAPEGQQSHGVCGELGYAVIGTVYRVLPALDKDVTVVCEVPPAPTSAAATSTPAGVSD